MTISRKSLAWLVILGGWADIIVTLIGQIGSANVNENDPISRILLLFSPWAFITLGFLFHSVIGLIVYKSDKWIAIPLALIMLASHIIALFFWVLMFGLPVQIISTMIYFVPLILILIYGIKRLVFRQK
jgi:hypothetical protein